MPRKQYKKLISRNATKLVLLPPLTGLYIILSEMIAQRTTRNNILVVHICVLVAQNFNGIVSIVLHGLF